MLLWRPSLPTSTRALCTHWLRPPAAPGRAPPACPLTPCFLRRAALGAGATERAPSCCCSPSLAMDNLPEAGCAVHLQHTGWMGLPSHALPHGADVRTQQPGPQPRSNPAGSVHAPTRGARSLSRPQAQPPRRALPGALLRARRAARTHHMRCDPRGSMRCKTGRSEHGQHCAVMSDIPCEKTRAHPVSHYVSCAQLIHIHPLAMGSRRRVCELHHAAAFIALPSR
jgi:hypothetical protein